MKKNKLFFLLLPLILFLFSGHQKVFAQESVNTSFITIINPVRISPYTKSSKKSIEAEYSEVKKRSFPATWLLSFDVINNKDAVVFLKTFDKNQELGILMEVSSGSAKAAGVNYNLTDSWHRSNSIFLSGYSQKDRIKLIDSVFNNFKNKFGYYPASVGAWWIDSFSLDYMSKKYKVIANLNVSDQSGTDGYHVWGTYWSSPYYPNKYNAAIPASELTNKIDTVTLRWAPRDPLNGYISPNKNDSTRFSTQDYFTIGLDSNYFEKLLRLYTNNDFSQVTIGLEGDFPPEAYQRDYSAQLSIAEKLYSEGRVKFSTMKDFANNYRRKFSKLSPSILIETSDLLGSGKKAIWFQDPKYRVGLVYNPDQRQTYIVDLRSYYKDFVEPFYNAANTQYDLFSIVPSIIDSSINNNSSVSLATGFFKEVKESNGEYNVDFEKGKIIFKDDRIEIADFPFKLDSKTAGLVKVKGDSIIPSDKFIISSDGLNFTEIKPKIPFALKSRIPTVVIYLAVSAILFATIILLIFLKKKNKKHFTLFVFFLLIIFFTYLLFRLTSRLYVSQSEIDALLVLRNQDDGKVLLYDKDCLRCNWATKNKPAAMEGRKNYVGKMSQKQFFYNLDFVLAKNPEEAKTILKSTKTRYIYLTKYEDYIESLSFSPLDIGVRKVYENANATIYQAY